MSKKIMLLALAVASVAMFALPAGASAAELHLENVTEFSGTAGAGSLSAEGEPTITCASGHVKGTVDTGGTTGTIHFDFTECHTTVFGFTAKCRSAGSALDNTITTEGTWHLITTSQPAGHTGAAIMVTPFTTEIICAGISKVFVHGDVIGTIVDNGSSLTCTRESKTMVTHFTAPNNIQEHDLYTGVTHALTATTGETGAARTAGLNSTGTTTSENLGKLNCT